MSENEKLARRGYEALAAGDMETVIELVDPDVEVEIYTERPDLPESRRFHGREGFLKNIGQLADVFDDIEIVPQEFLQVGDQLVVTIHTAARGRTSRITVENRIVHVWTIRDGKATRFRVYPTREQALAAAAKPD
jgi:ketosteroid isomerase-like protein